MNEIIIKTLKQQIVTARCEGCWHDIVKRYTSAKRLFNRPPRDGSKFFVAPIGTLVIPISDGEIDLVATLGITEIASVTDPTKTVAVKIFSLAPQQTAHFVIEDKSGLHLYQVTNPTPLRHENLVCKLHSAKLGRPPVPCGFSC